jgi:predicted DNA-binding WGR domain protein
MISFTDFLHHRLEGGGFTTEDALASLLPMIRQVVAAHRVGLVAPLQGVNGVNVENSRLWFEEAQLSKPKLEPGRLREFEKPKAGAVDIVGHYRVDMHVENGIDDIVSLQIGRRGDPVVQAVYLPGYVSWEQELGHHDPLADIFVLGLILASLSCGLDFNDPEDLTAFVQRRRNLFDLNQQLHPVLAKAIVRMTELDRHRRPQDLAALLRMLENYRDQDVDLDFDLARLPTFATGDRRTRRDLILSCLQERLFEISRRNRLLHFHATTQTVNLTWASVPLSFDVQNIRPEQILTWGHAFREAISAGGQISLNKYLRFEEALYLPGQLDEIRNEARRDQTEFGFAQLRLVVCFLRWANLKEKPPQRYDSPLVLVPVRLVKTKGVRDVYMLEPTGTAAEINPVLRFYLKQLYAVDLPESIDLTQASLDELYVHLAAKVQASEPAVSVEKIDKPRINLIQAKAQRRLDQYRRRVRLSGRGVRSFLDIDYSYDRANYHPLGLRLFQNRIAHAEPRLRTVIEESPRPRKHMMPALAAPLAEKERQLYSQAEEEANPYRWEFDLCNVTLGNFHYRKMSLVRDYAALLDRSDSHAAFDAIFSMEPREASTSPPKPLTIEEGYPIVSCDPTQASAVALARTGKHFIIQGPPGTGKSQTITNLVADFVARGQRVLFVCEKRAAIDVVYHRLHQARLHELCCLIHDAQDDKKEFIADLKATYEAFLGTKGDQLAKTEQQRRKLLDEFKTEMAPLERFDAAMRTAPPQAAIPLRQLLMRCIELRDSMPVLPPRDREQLPAYKLWQENRGTIERLRDHLQAIQGNSSLAKHPLKWLHHRFAEVDRPREEIDEVLAKVAPATDKIEKQFEAVRLPPACWDTLAKIAGLVEYAGGLAFLAEHDLLAVLTAKSALAKKWASIRKKYSAKEDDFKKAQLRTTHWRKKLTPSETATALRQAREEEKSRWRFFQPGWWRLRGALRRSYNFDGHQLQPAYSAVLEDLEREHQAVAALEQVEAAAREEFFFEGPFAGFAERIAALMAGPDKLRSYLQSFHSHALASASGNGTVLALANLRPSISQLRKDLAGFLEDTQDLSLARLRDEVNLIEESLDDLPAFVPVLQEIARLPGAVSNAWRRFPLEAEQLEAGSAARTIDELLRGNPELARFNGGTQATHLANLEKIQERWYQVSASTVRDRVCEEFLEHVRIATLPHGQLTAYQKEFKGSYNRGRRELEHEFNKTMRFRAIRDLVSGDTGLVLHDLKPIWLMSPLSVSDALPLIASFDVVIFDEASQVTLEEAVPAIFRANQVLVVGDEMQLPPTNFFAGKARGEEEPLLLEDAAGQPIEYDLSTNSFLNHAARNLPATMLGWHYRSRSESLISFSNAAFYQGRLLTVPEVSPRPSEVSEIKIGAAEEGFAHVDQLLERAVSFHFLERGLYDQRRNTVEAEYIAQLVRGLLTKEVGASIGIIAFSEAQQGEIEQALKRLALEEEEFRSRLEAQWEREEDGQFVGLLVKNLENIQGDERDIIILSVCYGPGPSGKMLMNFGPINQGGGERRLNVAFSRAKKHMALVSSIRHQAVTNDYNDGARTLKNYLRYAEALSAGDVDAAFRVLWEINPAQDLRSRGPTKDIVIDKIVSQLQTRGYMVDRDVGQSNFRCDLAIRRPTDSRFRLGIMVDTENYYQNDNLLERDVLRPRLLRSFSWNVLLVLTKDWFDSPDAVMSVIERQLTRGGEVDPTGGSLPGESFKRNMSWKRYLEWKTDSSGKFWEICVDGNKHTIRFGILGNDGQSKTKSFPDAAAADRDARRLVEEKLGKGYAEK